MSARDLATRRARTPALVGFLALAAACRAGARVENDTRVEDDPVGIDASALATFDPDVGGGLALAQELTHLCAGRLDFELGVERQRLDEEGPAGDEWTRVWGGARLGPEPGESGPDAGLGVTWLRSNGVVDELDAPGDYGGAYLGLGWLFALGGGWATGPELTGYYVDAEGTRGGSSALFQLAWRVVMRW